MQKPLPSCSDVAFEPNGLRILKTWRELRKYTFIFTFNGHFTCAFFGSEPCEAWSLPTEFNHAVSSKNTPDPFIPQTTNTLAGAGANVKKLDLARVEKENF